MSAVHGTRQPAAKNLHVSIGVNQVRNCLDFLSAHDICVLDVLIGCRHPLVTIQDPGARLHGALSVRRKCGRGIEQVLVTTIHGCQVQWLERAAP